MRVAKARIFASFTILASGAALRCVLGCAPEHGASPSADGDVTAGVAGPPAEAGLRADASPVEDPGVDAGVAHVEGAMYYIVGRFEAGSGSGPRIGWSGTQIRARFSGEGIGLVLADTGVSHYDVSIDGAAPTLLVVSGGARTYAVASGLAPRQHDLVVTKRTESLTGVTELAGFVGALVPSPAPSGRRIELVGDSITCGFGVLGADATCAFSPETESEPLAWGAIAAKELGAMHVVTAVSGIGVLRNYDGTTEDTMPERYDRALADDPDSTWDHAAFAPDLIVVNLGTNDFAGGKGDPGPGFEEAYTRFLAALRDKHPAAWIVVATSPMLSGETHARHWAYLEGALAARRRAGDTKLSLLDLPEQSEADGYGCGYHPSTTTQKKMATRLVALVTSLLDW